ncbi:MAG: hypothetical protein HY645_13775 [Acidobacteria bacterium]|nr:hypothetical protein [Acidobacteriota bacterium]
MGALDQAYFKFTPRLDRKFHVIGFGLNAVDWICVLPSFPTFDSKLEISRLYQLGGGQTATACTLCARYGLRVSYIGRVGDDDLGRFSLRDLQQEAMDTSLVTTLAGASSQMAVILVDEKSGERTILWHRDPRLAYRPEDLQRQQIINGSLLHLDGHDQAAAIQAAVWAREAGMKVVLDVDKVRAGVEELLRVTDFLIPSVNFIRDLTGAENWRNGLHDLAKATTAFVAVTLGKDGCAAVWDGQIHEIPTIKVEAKDTTGAGDVFHGAFSYSLFQRWSVGQCLRFANTAAALSCKKLGARGGIPALPEVLNALENFRGHQ